MKYLATLFAAALCCSMGARAADTAMAPAKAPSAQNNKMVTCQKDAGDKKLAGKERQAFVSDCLKTKPAAEAASAPMSQGQKLGACSKEAKAKGLKGKERNAYLSECSKAKT